MWFDCSRLTANIQVLTDSVQSSVDDEVDVTAVYVTEALVEPRATQHHLGPHTTFITHQQHHSSVTQSALLVRQSGFVSLFTMKTNFFGENETA